MEQVVITKRTIQGVLLSCRVLARAVSIECMHVPSPVALLHHNAKGCVSIILALIFYLGSSCKNHANNLLLFFA